MSAAVFDNPDGSHPLPHLLPTQLDKKGLAVDEKVDEFTKFCRKNPFYPAGISDYLEPSFGEYCRSLSSEIHYKDWRWKGTQKKIKHQKSPAEDIKNPFSPAGLPNELEPSFSEQCRGALLDALLAPPQSKEDLNKRHLDVTPYTAEVSIVPNNNTLQWSSVSMDLASDGYPQSMSGIRDGHSETCKAKAQIQEKVEYETVEQTEHSIIEESHHEFKTKSLLLSNRLSLPILEPLADVDIFTDAVETFSSADCTGTAMTESLAFVINESENALTRRYSDPSVLISETWSLPLASPEWKPVCSEPGWRPAMTIEDLSKEVKEWQLNHNEAQEESEQDRAVHWEKGWRPAMTIEDFSKEMNEWQLDINEVQEESEQDRAVRWVEGWRPAMIIEDFSNEIKEWQRNHKQVLEETVEDKAEDHWEEEDPLEEPLSRSLRERPVQKENMPVGLLSEEEILRCQLQALISPPTDRSSLSTGTGHVRDAATSMLQLKSPSQPSLRDRLYLTDRNLKTILALALLLPFLIYLLPALFAFLIRF